MQRKRRPSLLCRGSCAFRVASAFVLRLDHTSLPDEHVRIAVMRDRFDVAADEARALRLLLPAQRANLRERYYVQHASGAISAGGRTMLRSWLTSPWPPTGPQ